MGRNNQEAYENQDRQFPTFKFLTKVYTTYCAPSGQKLRKDCRVIFIYVDTTLARYNRTISRVLAGCWFSLLTWHFALALSIARRILVICKRVDAYAQGLRTIIAHAWLYQ